MPRPFERGGGQMALTFSRFRLGRAALHLGAALRRGHWTIHCAGIRRELVEAFRFQRKPAVGDSNEVNSPELGIADSTTTVKTGAAHSAESRNQKAIPNLCSRHQYRGS